jgi:hypothetical protein
MTPDELDQAIRRIAGLTHEVDRNEWALADELGKFSPTEYEAALPKLIADTGWTRQRLTAHWMTARKWPEEKRIPEVTFAKHREYRYEPEQLKHQAETGTLGQPRPIVRRQEWTLTAMSKALVEIIETVDDSRMGDKAKVQRIAGIVATWRKIKKAA